MASILVVSPGHAPQRFSRQPWAYIEGIASQLRKHGHGVTIVGDGPSGGEDSHPPEAEFRYVDSVRSVSNIETVANAIEADACMWSLGPTASLYYGRSLPRISGTMMAIVPGPLYTPLEIASQLSVTDVPKIPSYGSLIVSSLVPRRWFREFLRGNFDRVIAPTTTVLKTIFGTLPQKEAIHVSHGRDTGLLNRQPENSSFRTDTPTPPDQPYVLNFGPPRPIRGATDFVDAVLKLREKRDDVVGVFLARIDDESDRAALEKIKNNLADREQRDAFHIVERYLTHAELTRYIKGASAVSLPYRIVQSTVPISIIEALGLGQPVVTTNVHGARELVPNPEWTVEPKDGVALASALKPFLNGMSINKEELTSHSPTWEKSVEPLANELRTVIEVQ